MLLPNLPVAALFAACLSTQVAAAEDPAILYNEVARKSNDSLLWGPYRPNLYFGVRPRIPKSLMGGLMWSRVDNYQDVQNSTFGPARLLHL
ncbi:MAG: hypothetical protein CL912_09515 [Deltaproteobacteria bacterium]|nr:hypothetical protein [Deltaproteobacteria bacterium]